MTTYPQRRPCPGCPWWRHNPTDGSQILNFSPAKMAELIATVGDGSDGFWTIMACHHSEEGADSPCIGYVARHGLSNLRLRVAASDGRIDLVGIVDDCEGLDLYDTLAEMFDAYGLPYDDQDQQCPIIRAAIAVDASPEQETPCPTPHRPTTPGSGTAPDSETTSTPSRSAPPLRTDASSAPASSSCPSSPRSS